MFIQKDFSSEYFLFETSTEIATNTVEYQDNSIIPITPFKSAELIPCSDVGTFELHNSICLFEMKNPKIRQITENLGLSKIETQGQLSLLKTERKAYSIFEEEISEYVEYFSTKGTTQHLHDIYIGTPKSTTSTIDFDLDTPKKIGLHVDNWDRLSATELTKAQNRICINLGKGPRYFLFADFLVSDLIDKVDKENRGFINSNKLASDFLLSNRNTKIFAVKLNPLQGYIAPTENLMHDGSNYNSMFTDVQLTARGYFKPCTSGYL